MAYNRCVACMLAVCLLGGLAPTAGAEPAAAESVYLGDVDESGAADSSDARAVLQSAVGKGELTDTARFFADMSADGAVDSADARMILQTAVGKLHRPACRVVDMAGDRVEVLHSGFRRSLLPPVTNALLTDAAGWRAYCQTAENEAFAAERYDEAFFAAHDLLLLTLPDTGCEPEGIRVGCVYDNGTYCLPELLYSGALHEDWRCSMVLAVPLEKGAVTSMPQGAAWTFSPTAQAEQPLISYSPMAALEHPGLVPLDLQQIRQAGTPAELEAAVAAYAEAAGAVEPVFEQFAAAYDDAYFEQNALVLIPVADTPFHYVIRSLDEQADGTLRLAVCEEFVGSKVLGMVRAYGVLALQICKTDLAGRTVSAFEIVEERNMDDLPH